MSSIYSNKYSGLQSSMPLVPNSQISTNPTHKSIFSEGGYKSVNAINGEVVDGNNIFGLLTLPEDYLEIGMLVYVASTNSIYKLKHLNNLLSSETVTSLDNWEVINGDGLSIPLNFSNTEMVDGLNTIKLNRQKKFR